MSNAINMERNGLPAVTIVHERFEGPAKANAKFLKLLSARIVVIIEGTGTPTPEEQRKKIDGVWPQILKGLTSAH